LHSIKNGLIFLGNSQKFTITTYINPTRIRPMKSNFGHHLKSIAIFNLFGRYSYKLPATGESLDTLSIIYGENGAGKTTLLNLVFHLLSPASNRGHRSKIASTPFSTLEVILIDGTKLTATKDSQLLTGPVLFTIEPPVGRKVQWRFIPGNTEGSLNIEDIPASIDVKKLPPDIRKHVIYTLEKRRFFEEIGKLQINTLLLTADRLLLGDKIEETSKLEIPRDRARSRNQVAEIVRDYRIYVASQKIS
jgi:energy-coupling factor transporter ATP-binding protein EcfA2